MTKVRMTNDGMATMDDVSEVITMIKRQRDGICMTMLVWRRWQEEIGTTKLELRRSYASMFTIAWQRGKDHDGTTSV